MIQFRTAWRRRVGSDSLVLHNAQDRSLLTKNYAHYDFRIGQAYETAARRGLRPQFLEEAQWAYDNAIAVAESAAEEGDLLDVTLALDLAASIAPTLGRRAEHQRVSQRIQQRHILRGSWLDATHAHREGAFRNAARALHQLSPQQIRALTRHEQNQYVRMIRELGDYLHEPNMRIGRERADDPHGPNLNLIGQRQLLEHLNRAGVSASHAQLRTLRRARQQRPFTNAADLSQRVRSLPLDALHYLVTHFRFELPSRININHASEEQLRLLPGIGPHLATRIDIIRARNGRFLGLADLQRRVPGIGDRTARALDALIEF